MTFYSPYLSAALVNFRGEGQLIEFGFLFWLFLFYFFIPFVLDIEGITIELIKSWLLVVFVILCSLAILLVLDKTITRWMIFFIFLIFLIFFVFWLLAGSSSWGSSTGIGYTNGISIDTSAGFMDGDYYGWSLGGRLLISWIQSWLSSSKVSASLLVTFWNWIFSSLRNWGIARCSYSN